MATVTIAAPVLEQIGEFTVLEANEGVGADAEYFYAVNNFVLQVRQEGEVL